MLPLLLGPAAAFQHLHAPLAATSRNSLPKLSLVSGAHDDVEVDVDDGSHPLASRRSFFAQSLTAALAAPSIASLVAPSIAFASDDSSSYDDPDFGFRFRVPSSWESTVQQISGRRKAVFFTDPASKDAESGSIETLGFVAYTPIRDDFTSLSSFGSVDEVAQATIMPKGELAGGDTGASKMLSALSKNNAYYFDYVTTPVVPTEPGTSSGVMTKTLKPLHFRTIFTLLPLKNSAGLTLVTITLQTTEERYEGVKGVFDGVMDSYGKITS